MRTRRGLGFAVATFVVCLVAAAPACSSKEPSRPPALGDCIPIHDASCSNGGSSGAGGGPGEGDASESEGGSPISDAGACGVAPTYIVTANLGCVPCVESHCCLASQVCSINPLASSGCVQLLACMEGCSGNQACEGGCENAATVGVTPYNDLAMCIAINCPQCPPLPQTTPNEQ